MEQKKSRVSKKSGRLTQSKLSFAGPSTSQASAAAVPAGPTADDIESLANDTAYYLLMTDAHKEGAKKKDIVKHALKNNGRLLRTVMPLAKKQLEDVFGYTVADIGDKQGTVILINKLDLSRCKDVLNKYKSEEELAKEGFILIILTLIMMKGGTVLSGDLWKMLAPYGISKDSLDPTLGDVEELVTGELVKQHYLECSLIPGTDPPVTHYGWGMRAKLELPKRKVLEMVCEILGTGTKPEQWVSIYDDVVRSEQAMQGN